MIRSVCPAPAARHTNIINAFAKVSQHRAAIEWLEVMEDAHHSPNVLSFTCAIEVGHGVNRCNFGALGPRPPRPGLSLGQRVGRGIVPVAAHAAARPSTNLLLAFICEAMHEKHEMNDFLRYFEGRKRIQIPETYVRKTLERDSLSFFCSRCPCRFCSHTQAQSTNGIRGAFL